MIQLELQLELQLQPALKLPIYEPEFPIVISSTSTFPFFHHGLAQLGIGSRSKVVGQWADKLRLTHSPSHSQSQSQTQTHTASHQSIVHPRSSILVSGSIQFPRTT